MFFCLRLGAWVAIGSCLERCQVLWAMPGKLNLLHNKIESRNSSNQGSIRRRGRGGEGGSGTQNFVYQKWPDKIFPVVNFASLL